MKANIVKINTLAPLTSSEGEGVAAAAAAAAAGFVVETYFVHTSLGAVPDLEAAWKLFHVPTVFFVLW